MADKKINPVAKYSMIVGALVATLSLFGWFVDRDLLPQTRADAEVQQQKNDQKHIANEIRQLRAEWRYITDKITYYKKEQNDAMVAELKKRLREIEMDIAAIEKGN